MTDYLIRRFLGMMLVIGLILTVTFVITYLIPAEPARAVAGPRARPETIELIRQDLGLDDPLYVQYFRYLGRVLRGDLGTSYRQRLPVAEILARRLPATGKLAITGVIVELVLGIPIGIISAVWQRSFWDRLFMVLSLLGVSAPSFWLGLVLLYLFAYRIPLFPLGGPGGLAHLILPAATLGLAGAAWYARMLRSSMLDILGADYVRTARAKGLSERSVLIRHALRNALQPIVTMAGMDLGYYLGGLVLTEAVFSWPGIGYEMWRAVANVDIPVVLGTITFAAVAIVVMNFVVDLLYSVLDPRVRLAG
jgi:ABC-type dipeptide/oligopeptide/nickel transport system permease component